MTTLSAGEIRSYAQSAGFSGDDLNIAVAVALAESGGRTDSHNTVPPDDSYGLWQINMLGSLGPARRKAFGISSNSQLFDPAINAKAAHIVFQQSGWNAWSTYTNGEYKKFFSVEAALVNGVDSLNPFSSLKGIPNAINSFGETFYRGMASAIAAVTAVALLVLGVVIVLRKPIVDGTSKVVSGAKTVAKVVPK